MQRTILVIAAFVTATLVTGCLSHESAIDSATSDMVESSDASETLCECNAASVGSPCGWNGMGICQSRTNDEDGSLVYACVCANPLSSDCPAELTCQ